MANIATTAHRAHGPSLEGDETVTIVTVDAPPIDAAWRARWRQLVAMTATGGNLEFTVEALRQFDLRSSEGDPVHVVGAMYDLATGKVTVHDDDGLLEP